MDDFDYFEPDSADLFLESINKSLAKKQNTRNNDYAEEFNQLALLKEKASKYKKCTSLSCLCRITI